MFTSNKSLFTLEGGSLFTIAPRITKNEKVGCKIVEPVVRKQTKNGIDCKAIACDEESVELSLTEFKNNRKGNDWFLTERPFHQLCKQAISSALYRKSKRATLHNGSTHRPVFVPVVGLMPSAYEMALYDPDTDILLKSLEPKPLFNKDHSLSSFAIIDLWLAVHHSIFASNLRADVVKFILDSDALCNLQKGVIPSKEFDRIVSSSTMFLKISKDSRLRDPSSRTQVSRDFCDQQ